MDYFQNVVAEFRRANRATFINTEYLIQLNPGDKPPKGESWYCDAVALNLQDKSAFLCEVTYSQTLHVLAKRLHAWTSNWNGIRVALLRDSGIPLEWPVQPWVFIPKHTEPVLQKHLAGMNFEANYGMPAPAVTYLEEVVPWKYVTWNRKLEATEDGPAE